MHLPRLHPVRIILTILPALIVVVPCVVFAESTFVPLAPLPGLTDAQYTDIKAYVNAVYGFAIGISAILAVIMIVYHGIMYMLKEAVPAKGEELGGIRQAVFGLILLVVVYLLLYVINPNILDLGALESSLQSAPANGGSNIPVDTSRDLTQDLTNGIDTLPLLPGGP